MKNKINWDLLTKGPLLPHSRIPDNPAMVANFEAFWEENCLPKLRVFEGQYYPKDYVDHTEL